ncbi:hypothetical protein [Paenibacillus sp. y28]|uniref:hypothetical protein n=1 Tax=Paenibacillus sp. y28 TaxID=3129110 RepID=UPI0030163D3E
MNPQPSTNPGFQAANAQTAPVLTVKDWFITYLITFIPIVNIIMLFVWGFGGDTNPSKANWAKAALLWLLISIVVSIIFYVVFAVLLAGIFGAAMNSSNF